ncbi:MAG: OmpA family protein [Aeromonas sp.]
MVPSLLAIVLASVGATAANAADDWYAGFGSGLNFARDLSDYGNGAQERMSSLSVHGGYNFNETYAAELGYMVNRTGGFKGADFKNHGGTISGLARMPLADYFSAFAEGGVYVNHMSGNFTSDNGIAPLAGLGLTMNLSDLTDLQLRYRHMWNVGDESTWETDQDIVSFEVIFHPFRTSYVAPVVAPVVAEAAPVIVEKDFSLDSDVLFAFGKATLKQEGVDALNGLYQQIVEMQPKDGNAVVVGYTDRIGSEAANLKLSEARARTVADFLVSKGMAASKVAVEGRGEANPVTGTQCDNVKGKAAVINCLAADRRVEVRVTGVQEVQQ